MLKQKVKCHKCGKEQLTRRLHEFNFYCPFICKGCGKVCQCIKGRNTDLEA